MVDMPLNQITKPNPIKIDISESNPEYIKARSDSMNSFVSSCTYLSAIMHMHFLASMSI